MTWVTRLVNAAMPVVFAQRPKTFRSVLVGDILELHDEFPLATPASPVTGWMLVNDTPIRQDHDHGRTAHVDENVPVTAAVRPRP
jgi:hypothetical protein